MANVQHSSLTDPNLHEPKGIAGTPPNQVYISDGSDSGAWTNITNLPGTGWGQYGHNTYTGTTYLSVSTTPVLVPFNTDTNVTQLPISFAGASSPLMNTSTSTLLFVSENDMHSVNLSFTLAAVSATSIDHFDLVMFGSSDGTTYSTNLSQITIPILKATSLPEYFNVNALFPISANMASYGARIYINTDSATASLKDFRLISTRVHKAR